MAQTAPTRPVTTGQWLRRLRIVPLISMAMFSGGFLTSLTHEVIGHGITGILLGQSFYAFYVSPVGVSEAYIDMRGAPPWKEGVVTAGGIVSDILLGLLILLAFRIVKRSTPKLLLFFWAEDSLIGGSTYLASSAAISIVTGVPNGDPYWISYYLNVPLQALALVGFGLTLIFYYFLFKGLVRLLSDDLVYIDRRDALVSVSALWLLGAVPIRLLSIGLEGEATAKVLRLAFTAAAILVTGNLAVLRQRLNPPGLPRYVVVRQYIALALIAALAMATWLGAFGPTSTTAHGIVIEERPNYVNVRVTLWRNLTAEVELAFRPGPFDGAWASLRGSEPRWGQYLAEAESFASAMFGTNGYQVLDHFTDDGAFWYLGEWHGEGSRVIRMRVLALKVAVGGEGHMSLVLRDPWKPEGFTDSVRISLKGLYLVNSTPRGTMNYSDTAESIVWLNNSTEASPFEYALIVAER